MNVAFYNASSLRSKYVTGNQTKLKGRRTVVTGFNSQTCCRHQNSNSKSPSLKIIFFGFYRWKRRNRHLLRFSVRPQTKQKFEKIHREDYYSSQSGLKAAHYIVLRYITSHSEDLSWTVVMRNAKLNSNILICEEWATKLCGCCCKGEFYSRQLVLVLYLNQCKQDYRK